MNNIVAIANILLLTLVAIANTLLILIALAAIGNMLSIALVAIAKPNMLLMALVAISQYAIIPSGCLTVASLSLTRTVVCHHTPAHNHMT